MAEKKQLGIWSILYKVDPIILHVYELNIVNAE